MLLGVMDKSSVQYGGHLRPHLFHVEMDIKSQILLDSRFILNTSRFFFFQFRKILGKQCDLHEASEWGASAYGFHTRVQQGLSESYLRTSQTLFSRPIMFTPLDSAVRCSM